MKVRKIALCALLIVIFLTQYSVVAHAADVTLYKNRVYGYLVEFNITIPENIVKYLSIHRTFDFANNDYYEKYDFYFALNDSEVKTQLFTFYVMDEYNYTGSKYKLVKRTKDFIFCADFTQQAAPSDAYAKMVYQSCRNVFTDIDNFGRLITVPKSQQLEYEYTVFLNRSPLKTKLIIVDGAYFLPMREVFEKMSYKVEWINKTSTIRISKGSASYSFAIKNGGYHTKSARIIVRNGTAYIFIAFFVSPLEMNYTIAKYDNIYLY